MRLRTKIGLVVGVLITTFLFGRCQRQTSGPNKAVVTTLPIGDSEQITVDPSTHQLIILRPGKKIVETLPDRPSTIDILKNGTVNVTSKQFGFEHRLFVGVQGSDHLRLAAGMDGWYFKKLDLGLGIADQVGPYLPIVFGQVSYNIWSNCRVGLAYGTDRYIGATLTVRI